MNWNGNTSHTSVSMTMECVYAKHVKQVTIVNQPGMFRFAQSLFIATVAH
jgi:hypothetical protein